MQLVIIVPFILITSHSINTPLAILVADFTAIVALAVFSAFAAHRPRILQALFYFYILRFLELGIFVWAFFEVIIFNRFTTTMRGWQTEGRRYQISTENLKDIR